MSPKIVDKTLKRKRGGGGLKISKNQGGDKGTERMKQNPRKHRRTKHQLIHIGTINKKNKNNSD